MASWIADHIWTCEEIAARDVVPVVYDLARSEQPDLILLDMHLPCGSGEFVLQSLRKQPSCSRIPVIIMSGDTDLDEDALGEMGAVAVFRKPVDVHAFLRAIKEWAGKEVPELVPA